MRVVIAPDKFKGSLSAPDVARHLAAGLQAATGSNLDIVLIPVADGGEGTLDAAVGSGFSPPQRGRERAHRGTADRRLRGPRPGGGHRDGGRLRAGGPARQRRRRLGQRHRRHEPGHRRADPRGAGRRLPADHPRASAAAPTPTAAPASCRASAPGSSTPTGRELPPGGAALARLDRIDFTGFDPRLDETRFVLASDVDNPLLGAEGAAAVFGPQKGASPADVAALDAALAHFVEVLAGELGPRAVKAAAGPRRRGSRRGGLRRDRGTGSHPPAGHRRRPRIHRARGAAGRRGSGDHRGRQPGRTKPARQDPDGCRPGGGAGRHSGHRRLRTHHAGPGTAHGCRVPRGPRFDGARKQCRHMYSGGGSAAGTPGTEHRRCSWRRPGRCTTRPRARSA